VRRAITATPHDLLFDHSAAPLRKWGDLGSLVPATSRNDHLQYPARYMPKAARVLAALKRDGWTETRRRGSHRVLVKDDRQRVWAYHEGVDLGGRRWLGSPRTTVTPLLSCASYRTMIR
jgi:predicted RNA binding protein YcfA (HicA-like mRNA interferase family)